MRTITGFLAAGAVVSLGLGAGVAAADPIPGSVWMSPGSIPQSSVYHWAAAQPTATGGASFVSNRLCGSPTADLARPNSSALATQAASTAGASVVQAVGKWTDAAQAGAFQSGIHSQMNMCPGVNNVQNINTRDMPQWSGFATTIQLGERDHLTSEVHIYNVVPAGSGTMSELAVTVPMVNSMSTWQPVSDESVMQALARPLCQGGC